MADYALTARSILDGYRKSLGDLEIREDASLSLVSIAVAKDQRAALQDAMQQHFGLAMPTIGRSCATHPGNSRLLGIQKDQFLYMSDRTDDNTVTTVSRQLQGLSYCTDQSDSWAVLRLSGSECRRTLARMCMIDLDEASFPVDSVARTTIEHMAVIIIADTDSSYVLLTPRSSAASFVHALETNA